ncbi:O-antigen ligase family protein [Pedobacter sp. PWIIR3]
MHALVSRIKDKQSVGIFAAAILLIALLVSSLVATIGVSGGVFLLVVTITPIAIFCIIKFPRFGVIVFMISAYFIMFIIKLGLVNFPLGTLMDGMLLLLLIGFFVNQKMDPNWEILNNSISFIVIIWIVYNVIEVVNPNAESRLAWLYTIRSLAGVMFSYFIFMYQIRTIKFVRFIIKIWLLMSVIAAVYALKQEFIGFSAFEQRDLDNNPLLADLLFIDGHWRKFSVFADPISFSYNMNVSSILCIGLLFGPFSKKRKIILVLMIILFTTSMLFSGTRAAYILIPVALSLLFILNLNFKMIVVGIFVAFTFVFLIYVPTSNYTLYRFQTAFKPSNDASFNVRKKNQKKIQPYIQSHPMGGGLGSSGASGAKFSPNSVLGSFPPDSGYVRAGIEQGWVGLILLCTLFFVALRKGINNYFKIKDSELKCYCLAMTLIIFALCMGNYPQEGLIQFPLNIYFCLFMALINITLTLDQKKEKEALIVKKHVGE